MTENEMLKGAYDIHVHAIPDVVPRAQDLHQLGQDASQLGMAGLVIKDHCTSTVGRTTTMNRAGSGCTFYGALALNPPTGGLNPCAVDSALRGGARIIYFPTYGARNHIQRWGIGKPPTAFPLPSQRYSGEVIIEKDRLKDDCWSILRLIADHDAVLATGHISPHESLTLLRAARDVGVKRMVVTHVSESVTPLSLDQQSLAVELGAFLEHCFFAVTDLCPQSVPLETIRDQIRTVGPESCILSSDLGQVENPDPIAGFSFYLKELQSTGLSEKELRTMISTNPDRLLN